MRTKNGTVVSNTFFILYYFTDYLITFSYDLTIINGVEAEKLEN